MAQCRFQAVQQPSAAQPGEIIEVILTVYDELVPEPNPHKGVVCILMPREWSFVSGEYDGSFGTGPLEPAPDWADSVEAVYPAAQFDGDMKWVGLLSDTGYTYQNPITVNATIYLQVGASEGVFNLGYLVTKATANMIDAGNPSWAPLSYPHTIGVPDSAATTTYAVERSQEWEDLLDRNSGWTGADGIYSIPLSGLDVPSVSESEKTLLLFSDTFIGQVDSSGRRIDAKLVNNTYAVMANNRPDPQHIEFFWGPEVNGRPTAVFVPETPDANPGDWYWMMDGIAIDETIYAFGLRLKTGSGGLFNFELIGVALISFTLGADNSIVNPQQVDTPLYYRDSAEGWEIVLGQAVMDMRAASGNAAADGYIYVYGPKNRPGGKELVVARVLPEYFENFTEWRYWDGSGWGTQVEQCASLTNYISQEFSVSNLDYGKYLLAFQLNDRVAFRMGESPVGPFDFYTTIYYCPEVNLNSNIFVYNAKAHPHLSEPGQLLISYNVNTFNFGDHIANADIYRPRFITLEINEAVLPVIVDAADATVKTYGLAQNYPNPFNASTRIRYRLETDGEVILTIYDILGRKIRHLIEQHQLKGEHSALWDGRNERGETVSSGAYIYALELNGDRTVTAKMLLIK